MSRKKNEHFARLWELGYRRYQASPSTYHDGDVFVKRIKRGEWGVWGRKLGCVVPDFNTPPASPVFPDSTAAAIWAQLERARN